MRLFDLAGKFITEAGIDRLIELGHGRIMEADDEDSNYDRVTEGISERLELWFVPEWMAQSDYVEPYEATFLANNETHARDIAKAGINGGVFVELHIKKIQSQTRLMMATDQSALPGFAALLAA